MRSDAPAQPASFRSGNRAREGSTGGLAPTSCPQTSPLQPLPMQLPGASSSQDCRIRVFCWSRDVPLEARPVARSSGQRVKNDSIRDQGRVLALPLFGVIQPLCHRGSEGSPGEHINTSAGLGCGHNPQTCVLCLYKFRKQQLAVHPWPRSWRPALPMRMESGTSGPRLHAACL